MDMKANLGNLMKEAQKMQKKMQEAQKELVNLEVTGESGAGMVQLIMNGRHDVKKVTLNPSLMDEDKEVLEDLIAAAINDAVRKIEKQSKDKIGQLASGINLPGDFNIPTGDDE